MKQIIVLHFANGSPTIGPNTRWFYLSKYMSQDFNISIIGSRTFHKYKCTNIPILQTTNNVDFIRLSNIPNKGRISQLISFVYFVFTSSLYIFKNYKGKNIFITSSPNIFVVIPALIHKMIFKSKIVFEVRDLWPKILVDIKGENINFFDKIIFKIFELLERLAVKYSDAIVSVKEGDYLYFNKFYNKNCFYIPNGSDFDSYDNNINQIFPKNNKIRIGYAGSLGDYYDLTPLIDAFNLLEHDLFELHILGDGPNLSYLKERVSFLKLENIYFFKSVPKIELDSYLRSFDFGFLPLKRLDSNKYGISCNKLYDYFRCSIPVLSFNDCEYDPVQKYNAGFKINSYEFEELAALINSLSSLESSVYIAISDNAFNAYKTEFNVVSSAAKYKDVIDGL